MKNFNINEQWQLYLKQVQIDNMPLDQVRQSFRAFLAGIMQLYVYINSDMHELSEHQALEVFKDIERQITDFLHQEGEFERVNRVPLKIDVSLPVPGEVLKLINDSIHDSFKDSKPWI